MVTRPEARRWSDPSRRQKQCASRIDNVKSARVFLPAPPKIGSHYAVTVTYPLSPQHLL